MDRIAGIILRYRIVFFVLTALLTAFFAHYASRAKTDNSIEVWLKQDDPKLDYYYDFIDKFGNEEFLIIAIDGDGFFTGEQIKYINSITTKVKEIKGVKEVISLASVYRDKISAPYFKELLKGDKDLSVMDAFRKEVLSDPMYVDNVISEEGNTTAIIATVTKGSPESRKELVNETREAIKATEISGEDELRQPLQKNEGEGAMTLPERISLAGPSIVNAELDRMSQRDMRTFTPVMFAVAIIILLILFRNVSGVLIPAITIIVSIIWSVGLFVIFHNKMNMVSGMLMPLIFIISLATTVHILKRFYQELKLSGDRAKSIRETVKHIGVPCFLTCLTTSIGFLSLMVSDVSPVKTTGIFMAAGIMMSFFVCMTITPGILSFCPVWMNSPFIRGIQNDDMAGRGELRGGYGYLAGFVKKNIITLFAVSTVCIGFAIYGITKTKVESNVFESFPADSEIARSTAKIEKNLMGLLPMEIVVNAIVAGGIFQPDVLINIEALQNYLNEIPEITKSVSVTDYVRKLNKLLSKEDLNTESITQEKALDYVKLASLHGDKIVKNLYSDDNNEGRVSVRMKNVGSARYQEITDTIEGFLRINFSPGVSCAITGIVPLLMDMQGYLIESQIKTFAFAFILIFLCIGLLLRSVRIGLMSMIPNLIPVVITLGVMGYTGIHLDVATIMIASVAIGISVDDTIHFLYRFKSEFKKDSDHYHAIQRTLNGVGGALIFTTVVATCGFMIFCLSGFKPIQYFGLLTGITMVSALLADIFVLPSCILLFKPKFN